MREKSEGTARDRVDLVSDTGKPQFGPSNRSSRGDRLTVSGDRTAGLARLDIGEPLGSPGRRTRPRRDRAVDSRGFRLDPDALWLELNETALLRAGHSATVELSAVQALGVHLGMDDFGTGYSSLTNLQRLPIDFFKIDRGFIASLDRDDGDRVGGSALVAALTELGATLGLRTIADGIETAEERDLLSTLGCRYGQGYLLARPMPANAHAELLAGSRVA